MRAGRMEDIVAVIFEKHTRLEKIKMNISVNWNK